MDKQFMEYFGSVFSGESIVLSELDEEAFEEVFEEYEKRQECARLFLAGY